MLEVNIKGAKPIIYEEGEEIDVMTSIIHTLVRLELLPEIDEVLRIGNSKLRIWFYE